MPVLLVSSGQKKMNPEEVLAAAKEMGLEFTGKELKEAAKTQKVTLDELSQATGGAGFVRRAREKGTSVSGSSINCLLVTISSRIRH